MTLGRPPFQITPELEAQISVAMQRPVLNALSRVNVKATLEAHGLPTNDKVIKHVKSNYQLFRFDLLAERTAATPIYRQGSSTFWSCGAMAERDGLNRNRFCEWVKANRPEHHFGPGKVKAKS